MSSSMIRTIAHLSDVHFGREDPLLVDGLLTALGEAKPEMIVVSGDLTQRARKRQFRAARNFLRQLPDVPLIVVPGNHDVSTTNLVERAVRPLARYKRFITNDLTPFFHDQEIAIAGINTVRVLSTKDGRINTRQVARACEQMADAGSQPLRIIVTHHPMDLPAEDRKNALVARSRTAMKMFALSRIDLFLSGHLHTGRTLATSARYPLPGYSAIVVHAGTAVSTRTRGEENGWNLIRVSPKLIEIEQQVWNRQRFEVSRTERYRKGDAGWASLPEPAGHAGR